MSSKELSIPWNTLPEGRVSKYSDQIWVVRTGVVVNRPKKQKCFEDSYLSLSSMEGEGNSTLGYIFQLKRKFENIFTQDSYVTLLASLQEPHKNPKLLFKDQKVYLYRFNAAKNPSYWLLVRNRTPQNT